MRYTAIVLAGGQGKRLNLGYNKVFYHLADQRTVLEHACAAFMQDNDCQKIILVLAKNESLPFKLAKETVICPGGARRSDSVRNALAVLDSEYVMIHDGARPDITLNDLAALKEALTENEAAILATAVKDTVKYVEDTYIKKTLPREKIFLAKTPQAFKSSLIKKAYALSSKELNFTDDASLVEYHQLAAIKIVCCSTANNKITFPADLL